MAETGLDLEGTQGMAELATPPPDSSAPKSALGFDALHRADDLVAEYVRHTPANPISTGFQALDKWLRGGFRRGRIYTIAARPGEGKSSIALSMARRIAVNGKLPIVYISLEMGKEELTERLLAQSLLLEPATLQRLREEGVLREKVLPIYHELRKSGLFHIEDARGARIDELDNLFEELADSHLHPAVLVIDYLQLIALPFGVSRVDAINTYMADLKNFAKSKQVAVILCCQINRQGDEKPALIHLKGAGGIEESSDVVIICSRPNFDHTKTSEEVGEDCDYELWIAKHRQGAIYKINLIYRPPCFEFLEPTGYGQPRHSALETKVLDDSEPTNNDAIPF